MVQKSAYIFILGLLVFLLSCEDNPTPLTPNNEIVNPPPCGSTQSWNASLMSNTTTGVTRTYTVSATPNTQPEQTMIEWYLFNKGYNSGPIKFVVTGSDYGATFSTTVSPNDYLTVYKTFSCPGGTVVNPNVSVDIKVVHTYSTSQDVGITVFKDDSGLPDVVNGVQVFSVAPVRSITVRTKKTGSAPGFNHADLYYKINSGSWIFFTDNYSTTVCADRGTFSANDGDVVSVAIERHTDGQSIPFWANSTSTCATSGTEYCGTRALGSSYSFTVSGNADLSFTAKGIDHDWASCP